jgi:hypothetical protein
MKYFSLGQIQEAVRRLRPHHSIFATTFFVMKKERVPVGQKVRFSLDAANRDFLHRHYRAHPKSEHFFRVMRQNNPGKDWNEPAYAGKGLQSVNTRGCRDAFLHDKNENTWGWSPAYVQALAQKLPRGERVPLFHIAVWLYRERGWPDSTSRSDVVGEIIKEYALTRQELRALFETGIASELPEHEAFSGRPVKWHEFLRGFSAPQDVPPEGGGLLAYLETDGVGPVDHLRFEPAKRLNIVTGDNGLGKTFLLDLAWWALTQDWAERPALPRLPLATEARIKFAISGTGQGGTVGATYSTSDLRWKVQDRLPAVSGLVVYGRVDGSYAVWDPANTVLSSGSSAGRWPGSKFTREQVWDGNGDQIEGLIRDWVRWQERPDKHAEFETFRAVLRRVWPADLGSLEVDDPVRLPGEIKYVPTLRHPYGVVPIVFESAGIKRIITLAYLLVWAWAEHRLQARQYGRREERQMVVILDEAEAHLHPKWQRIILPALLGIASDLHAELSVQLLVATHSPLVLASSEPVFDPDVDKLFLLEMTKSGKVELRERPFEVRGTVDSWLTSPLFQLSQPGSPAREEAIKQALRLQEEAAPSKQAILTATEGLANVLAPEDPFWVRWVFFAEKHGVAI